MKDANRLKDSSMIGKMYFYFYDPKTKDSLPYYDRFPLVLPIERYQDGFLGLNLHYIHPKQRIILLDKLSNTLSNRNYDENTRMRITYEYLNNFYLYIYNLKRRFRSCRPAPAWFSFGVYLGSGHAG